MSDRRVEGLRRAFSAGDEAAGIQLARMLIRSIDVLGSVTSMTSELQQALSLHVTNLGAVERVAQLIVDDHRDEIVEEVAGYFGAEEIAGHFSEYEIAGELDVADVAGYVDTSEVSRNLDLHDLAIDVAGLIEIEDLASKVADLLAADDA